MEREKIIEILKEESYPEFMIEQTVNKLENLEPEIKSAFEQWLNDGLSPTLSLEGYTYLDLVKNFGMNLKKILSYNED